MNDVMRPSVTFLPPPFPFPPGNGEGSAADAAGLRALDTKRRPDESPGVRRGGKGGSHFVAAEPARSRFVLPTKWHFPGLPVAFLIPARRGSFPSLSLAEGHAWQGHPQKKVDLEAGATKGSGAGSGRGRRGAGLWGTSVTGSLGSSLEADGDAVQPGHPGWVRGWDWDVPGRV